MNTQRAYLLIGAPGSGKSTHGKKMCENGERIVRVCPDEFRAILGWGEGDQSVSAQAFEATRGAMKNYLDDGKDVIVDATNMYRKSRKDFINIARGYGATVVALVFECDRQTLIERNIKRGAESGRNVPEHVIDSMLAKYERPTLAEFDEIHVITTNDPNWKFSAYRE
jgi:predicted kinase